MTERQRIEGYLGRLYGYALSLSENHHQAEDLVQDCALRAVSAKNTPHDERAYRAWLFRILRNAFLDQVRHLPDVRTDRIDAIRSAIRDGSYETDAKLDVAVGRLMDDLLID